MTQPTPETSPQHHPDPNPGAGQPAADEQPTVRLAPADPDATRPMSLADLLDSD
ncbi:hypothetical protein ACFPIJ_21930 [Dactylosporangium cerinum]|uniref:Uncharacterized protein n=1 Tax=Dactylosporangium cerinum TaxID=1434730 RepID=A0ABV9VY54_9ACTN